MKSEMEEDGVCRERIFDLVVRNLLLTRCGRSTGREGRHDSGTLATVRNRDTEASADGIEK